MTDEVRHLLFKHNLADDFASRLGPGDLLPANEEASNLIVSYVADRMARLRGIDTIADLEIPFAVQALDSLGAQAESYSRENDGL